MTSMLARDECLSAGRELRRNFDGVSEVVCVQQSDKPVSILIVEDDALIASYIKEVLAESGFGVAGVAASGPAAISLAAAESATLALVDIKLTGPMDGVELARELRRRFDIPAIFLSGLLDTATIDRAKAAQPLGFLHKPFRPSQVFNAIEGALAKAGR